MKEEIKQSRLKIKTYLDKNTNNTYFTIRQAKYWYNILNTAIFKNKLFMPELKVKKLKSNFGEFCYDNNTCSITLDKIKNKFEFFSTLGHEMTHQYQYQYYNGAINHGQNFKYWNDKFIKQLNISLITKYSYKTT